MASYTVDCVGSPLCPNHRCTMFPTGDTSIWICSISGVEFTMEAVDETEKKDKFGNVLKTYIMSGEEEDG